MRVVSVIANTLAAGFKPIFGIYPWFIIKIQLSYQLHLTYAKGQLPNLSKQKPQYTKPIKSKKLALKTLKSLLSKLPKLCYLHCIAKIPKVDVLAVGYLVHNKTVNGVSEPPYLYPHIKDLAPVNYQVYYIDNKDSLELSLQYVNLLITFFKLYFKLKLFLRKDKLKLLRAYGEQLNKKLHAEAGMPINGLEQFLAERIIEYKVHVLVYKFWLRKLKPTTVLGYCYYDNRINAMLGAANSLGIKTIECQHSAISNNHFAYAKWESPNKLITHFPTHFYLWSAVDKALVETNFNADLYSPMAEVKGMKHLGQQTPNMLQNAPQHILICLQGIWMPDWLENFICEDDDYQWFIRLHPRYPNDKIQLERVAKLQKSNICIEEANTSNLEALLVRSRILITCFSGTALEAIAFGVKVLIYGEEGKTTYNDYIAEGQFSYIEHKSSLNNEIKKK